ncbi:hypothetical protein FB451DRAFT_736987 [Mycena latifolia]|nr:hypothetical protein FB451DRAFT_736987 [Mycena latifolia]
MTLIFYGVFVVLFILAVYTLSRRKTQGRYILLLTSWAMFIFASTVLILDVVSTVLAVRIVQMSPDVPFSLPRLSSTLTLARNALFSCNTLLGDLLFLYRCYVIWGRRKNIIFVPCILVLATTITGVVYYTTRKNGLIPFSATYELDPRTPYILGVLTNLSLVALTAGRIWWIRRAAHIVCGNIFERRYGLALTLILESGAIYCVSGIILAIFASPNAPVIGVSP